jgi:putative protease
MLVDGEVRSLGSSRYLLSPEDLYALREIPQIVKLGVSALKIEGRYKDENYVALTTRAYRNAVDEAWSGLPLSFGKQDELQLAQVYSRGLGPHFLRGTNHQVVVPGRSPRHRGVFMGRVTAVASDAVVIAPDAANMVSPLKAGDGIVFDAADRRSPEEREEGGRVYQVTALKNGELRLQFANNAIDYARLSRGDWVWRSHDPELDKVCRPFTNAATPVHKQPVQVFVTARVAEPLIIEWLLEPRGNNKNLPVRVQSTDVLDPSHKHALSVELLRDQLGRLGNTPYVLADIQAVIEGNPFVPTSVLNELRRQAVAQLQELQSKNPSVTAIKHSPPGRGLGEGRRTNVRPGLRSEPANPVTHLPKSRPRLHLLVRTPEQLEASIAVRPDSITLDYLDLYGLRPAVERVRGANITARVASPRVLKPDEQRIVTFLVGLDCDIVVRSAGLLQALRRAGRGENVSETRGPAWIGDFGLNAANILTTRAFLDLGLQRITPTHDLNASQIADLANAIGSHHFEVIAYQHLPVFHTEHCVFCRFLSHGTSYEDCGHPCEKHRVALRDMNGRAHPVMADVGCRNTVFGAEAQEASQHLQRWREVGIEHYRIEFVHETHDQVTHIARAFAAALNGKLDHVGLKRELERALPQGITEGSLFVPDNYLEVPTML